MVTLCKRKHEMSDDTLMDLVTEAFPVVAFAKQLEDKSRKIMEIMECVIQPDGSRQYNTLYHFAIEDNRLEDGKYYIDGHHEPVHPISANLQKHFIDNGISKRFAGQMKNCLASGMRLSLNCRDLWPRLHKSWPTAVMC